MTIGYLATSIGYYDQHRLIVCIGRTSATDENVQSDENVPSPGRKRPRFRATSTKMSYIPSKACQAQGRKRPRFSKDENVPHSEGGTKTSQIQQGRKRPTFRGRYENGPDSAIGKVRKRPKFHLARGNENVPILETKRSHFQTMMQQQLFWFLCDQVRFLGKYAKICGENKNMRNYAENIELCGIVRRTGNCAKSHSPHLNVASDTVPIIDLTDNLSM